MHNKLKKKDAELPADVVYMAGEDVPPMWNCYPWVRNTPRVHAVTRLECVRGNPRRYIGAAFAAPLALAGSLGAPSACEGAGALGVLWHAL